MRKILIVEDNVDIRQLEYWLLAPYGKVFGAKNSAEANELSGALTFDLAVLDYHLEDSGWRPEEFAARLRAAGTRVALCSAIVDAGADMAHGPYDAVIPKPFEHEDFIRLALGDLLRARAYC